MQGIKLTDREVNALRDQYESELRKLEFQILQKRQALADLGHVEIISTTETAVVTPSSTTAKPAKRRGRPPKKKEAEASSDSNGQTQTAKKRGRPKKSQTKERKGRSSGYRLSEWDNFILDTLEKEQRTLINSQLLDMAMEKSNRENLGMNEQQLRGKLNRSLHKLANKRGILAKADYPGKGFAYGLDEWTNSSGEIKKKYHRK